MFGDKFNLGNLGALMKNAGKIESIMKDAKNKFAKIIATGESGAGAVKVTMNAQHFVKEILIDDDIIKEDKIILQELIASAVNNATQKIEKEKENLINASDVIKDIITKTKEDE